MRKPPTPLIKAAEREMGEATKGNPTYRKVQQETGRATTTFMIVCDEGWRESIVCSDMYEWAADWLLSKIQGLPYAPETRP